MADRYRDTHHALAAAMAAASVAADCCHVLSMASGDVENDVTERGRFALRTIALYGVEKVDEAQEAADMASVLLSR